MAGDLVWRSVHRCRTATPVSFRKPSGRLRWRSPVVAGVAFVRIGAEADPGFQPDERRHVRVVNSKSNSAMFSRIRDGVADFGITTLPSCRCQRSTTWAGVRPCRPAIAATTGSSSRLPWPERAPRLGDDAVRGVEGAQCRLLELRVQLDLVDRRDDLRSRRAAVQVGGLEVGHADRAGPSVGVELLEGPPGLDVQVQARLRPVDQVEVDVVQAELAAGSRRTRGTCCRSPGRRSTAWW